MNGSDIEFSDSRDNIEEDFGASSSEADEEAIECVSVNKDVVPTKVTDSKKRPVIWQKKEFDKRYSTWLHDHTIADTHTGNDQTSLGNLVGKYVTHQIYSLLAE